MPASSHSSAAYGWRESWPPAQIHLQPAATTGDRRGDDAATVKEETGGDLHNDNMQLTDDNPLVYFLTPTPLLSVDDDGESYFVDDSDSSSIFHDNEHDDDTGFYFGTSMDFEFDAGIEDDTYPQPIIRSVSPSSLSGTLGSGGRTSHTVMRPPTPPHSATARQPGRQPGNNNLTGADPLMFDNMDTAVVYEDGENYIHFGDGDYSAHRSPSSSPTIDRTSPRSSSHALSPPPLSSSPGEPRSLPDIHDLYTHHRLNNSQTHLSVAGATIVRRRSPRSWRVPSPDVFSIEEETAEELSSGVAASHGHPGRPHHDHHTSERHLHVEAAKPPLKKRVRFVLPGEEVAQGA
ncbi:hypothetical protein HMPREF1624_00471 [Sporothrix schenckii ATCC 58251]|uniref:Uncharacterized protein n=1 Tax=Sporothrix schenckii (strain ATCC 58251 / de Perez 2211183) TaxID=1391915 RepID=U7Q2T6_SPOS1|nr:hypothetical protein HMPREF1624_00471 [Sporothrix schenckii ATCC 58251]